MSALAASLPHHSTKYWQLKQCRLCGIPFDPYAEHPSARPPRPPTLCVQAGTTLDPLQWRCPYCVVVHKENEEFPVTLKGESLRHVAGSNMESRARREGALSNPVLNGSAFSSQPEQKPLLKEVLRVQRAVEWLEGCPILTLRILQQRVLCASESLFKTFLGLPPYLKPIDAPPTPHSDSGSDADTQKEEFILPPQPLTFTKFMTDFLILEYGEEYSSSAHIGRNGSSFSHTHSIDSALKYNSTGMHNAVLATGRPAPVAPVTSTNLIYGSQDEAIHTSAISMKRHTPRNGEGGSPERAAAGGTGRKYTQATTTLSAERDQNLMSEVMHWSNFFNKFFDENKEGQCRDPIFLFSAILLACANVGRKVLDNCTSAQIEREIEQQCLQHPSTHCTRCDACKELRERIKEYWRYQLRRLPQLYHDGYDAAEGIRFFLGTPVVVWWSATFLQLYRTTTNTVWKKEDVTTHHGDTLRPGEVYMIRDWIARQAEIDEKAFVAQRRVGSVLIPSSCSTNAKAYRIGFTKENVEAALKKISDWADESVMKGTPLEVRYLKELLRNEFPVMAYFITYFDPPVTCRHTRKRHPKNWVFSEGVVLRDPAVVVDAYEK